MLRSQEYQANIDTNLFDNIEKKGIFLIFLAIKLIYSRGTMTKGMQTICENMILME